MKVLSLTLWLLLIRLLEISSWGQNYLRGKYREWIEDNDRVEVRSWYAETEVELEQDWSLEFLGTIDAWSGATPYGIPPTSALTANQWLRVVPEEIRKAGLFTLSKKVRNHDFSFEYGISDEPDYLSRSYAIEYSYKLAAETLILTTGFSLQDDSVYDDFKGIFVGKRTPSLSAGLTRILDKFTSLSLNFSYSWPSGFLNDSYKGTPVDFGSTILLEAENRPNKRKIFIIFSELSRYLEVLNLGIHFSYRFFQDDHDLNGHTFDIETSRKIGEKWMLSPRYRFYHQQQASFYSPKIRKKEFFDSYMKPPNSSVGPFYSADHRLSSFDSQTLGLKATCFLKDNIHLDLSYDRYLTKGRDGITDNQLYSNANIFTVGFQWEY